MNKRSLYISMFFSLVLIFTCIFMSIGFSAMNKELTMAGDVVYTAPREVKVTGIYLNSTHYMEELYSPSYTKTTVSVGLSTIVERTATTSYSITVKNTTDTDKTISNYTSSYTNQYCLTHLSNRGIKIPTGGTKTFELTITCGFPNSVGASNFESTFTFEFIDYVPRYLVNNTNSAYFLDINQIPANKVEKISFLKDYYTLVNSSRYQNVTSYEVSQSHDGIRAFFFDEDNDGLYEVEIVSVNNVVYSGSTTRIGYNTSKLSEIDFTNFDTSYLTSMQGMFYNCKSLTSINLNGLNTSNVTDMQRMFYNCTKLTNITFTNIDTSNVTNMKEMFYSLNSDNSAAISLNLSALNTSSVKNFSYMFNKANVSSLTLTSFTTPAATNMSYMFSECTNLTSLNLSNFVPSKVTNFSYMFYKCNKLSNLNLSNFNTAKATNMSYMFSYTASTVGYNMSNLDLSAFNTSLVTDMSYMFYYCGILAVNLSNFNTPKLTNMASMFAYTKFSTIDLSTFNTSLVTDMSYLFQFNSNLTKIYVGSNFSTSAVTSYTNLFLGVSSLVGGAGTVYGASHSNDLSYAKIDGGTSSPGYFTAK